MKFSEILGQKLGKSLLCTQVAKGTPGHAYIFSGEEGSGKMMLAEAFAAALQCEDMTPGRTEACGMCKNCHQAMNHNHPDIVYVGHEKPNTLGVDDIRTGLVASMDIKPYSGKYKIYIIDEAEKISMQAQNAMLKTIEEPPEYGIVLLLTTNENAFLPTIMSRCTRIGMKPVENRLIEKLLMEKNAVVDYEARVIAAYAQGNVGKALALSESDEFKERKDLVLSIVKRPKRPYYEMLSIESSLKEDKENIKEYLELMSMWYKDVLLIKSTGRDEYITYKDEIYSLKSSAEAVSFAGISAILKEIEKARRFLSGNVNFELVIDRLLNVMKGCSDD